MTSDLRDAISRGLHDRKLVLVFFLDNSKFSGRETAAITKLRNDEAFCSSMLFVEAVLSDAPGIGLAQRLGISIAPAISVLLPSNRFLHEVTHFEGLYSARELKTNITRDVCEQYQTGEIQLRQTIGVALGCKLKVH